MTAPRMPQPGERWRIHVRPVEWDCPNCGAPLHLATKAPDGKVVTIVESQATLFIHNYLDCHTPIPIPEGWLVYPDGELYRTLPYTLFEPVEEPSVAS